MHNVSYTETRVALTIFLITGIKKRRRLSNRREGRYDDWRDGGSGGGGGGGGVEMNLTITSLTLLTVMVVMASAASTKPVSISASVSSSMAGTNAAAESRVTGPDGVTKGECVYSRDGSSIKVRFQEKPNGEVLAETDNGNANEALDALKKCRAEMIMAGRKVAMSSQNLEKTMEIMRKNSEDINNKMVQNSKNLDENLQKMEDKLNETLGDQMERLEVTIGKQMKVLDKAKENLDKQIQSLGLTEIKSG
ncbi:hypothetical protein Pmani_027276 [Petrolisthes manimaculis]|uniref:Uncharacterized protein n=1 Tax=Petrolisthes manimaculis TaxID=1843537 RepID=A0AAE1TWM7_9EUCA|nr:hypothetical protein Pmani_027276 [Petrolisthes manimaculis]